MPPKRAGKPSSSRNVVSTRMRALPTRSLKQELPLANSRSACGSPRVIPFITCKGSPAQGRQPFPRPVRASNKAAAIEGFAPKPVMDYALYMSVASGGSGRFCQHWQDARRRYSQQAGRNVASEGPPPCVALYRLLKRYRRRLLHHENATMVQSGSTA